MAVDVHDRQVGLEVEERGQSAADECLVVGPFDEGAFDDFVDDFRGPQGDAPEKFELDSLQQGSN